MSVSEERHPLNMGGQRDGSGALVTTALAKSVPMTVEPAAVGWLASQNRYLSGWAQTGPGTPGNTGL